MSPKWQDATISVPAGIPMTRVSDGKVRTWTAVLQFNAFRAINEKAEATDDIWHFYWLSKEFTVSQEQVQIVT